nr:retrovirus-related Pol polyprotein from transposon TNT 1-94 [Tanacetum cinerariifolium]
MAEITRKKINEKMKTPLWTHNKINIRPPDYSKENFLATFTPQTQLTFEQIIWSKDVLKMKTEALAEQAKAAKPVRALTVYPPNTPVKLVPRVFSTKNQVKINIFALIQLFSEFEKTCKTRITPTGLTKGERGFEQTKEFYLTEVISFFKTLREHFEGIQKALTKEIKEMKAIFDELKAEVDQNALNVSRFSEIRDAHTVVQAHCLELESELSKLKDKIQKDDHDVLVKCFSNLEVQHLNLQLKYQLLKESLGNNNSLPAQDGPDFESVFEIKKLKASIQGKDNAIRKLRTNNREVHLDYLKHLKKSVETLREIVEEAKVERPLDRSLASACLYTKHSQELLEYMIDTCPKDFNKRDKKQVTTPVTRKKQVTFVDQCETSYNNTRKHVEQRTTQKTYVPMIPSTGVSSCTDASGSKPRSNTKKNRISSATSVNRKTVEDHPRTNKSNLQKPNRVDSSISSKREQCPLTKFTQTKVMPAKQPENVSTSKIVVTENLSHTSQKPLTRYQRRNKLNKAVPAGIPTPTDTSMQPVVVSANQLDSNNNWGSKCPNSPSLSIFKCRNFVKKFIRIVRFENDHFSSILGYGDYVIGDSVISKVYDVEGLRHNLFSVGQFCDSNLEVAFRKHSCYVRDTDGVVDLIKGSRGSNLYTILVEDMMKSSLICLLSKTSKTKSWLWHRRLNQLNFGTINDLARKDLLRGLPRLKFEKDHICSACQLGKSKKHTHSPKTENTNLEALNTLHMDLYEPIRVQTVNGKKYILVIIDEYMRFTWVKFFRSKDETHSTRPAPTFLTPRQISSGLVPNLVPAAPYVPPTNKELEILFQPMFVEYLEPPHVERPVSPTPAVLDLVNSAGTPSSTSIDQDAPSLSHSPSSLALQSPCLHQGVADESTLMDENLFAPIDNDPFINVTPPNWPAAEYWVWGVLL